MSGRSVTDNTLQENVTKLGLRHITHSSKVPDVLINMIDIIGKGCSFYICYCRPIYCTSVVLVSIE